MGIKILHAADFHLDSPFTGFPEEKARSMRREQRSNFLKIAEIAEKEQVQLLLLPGDIFDSNLAYQETVDAVAGAFDGISAKVFIAPGNHDFLCLKSPYSKMKLPSNVHIFSSPSIKYVDVPELNCRVWGAGFTASRCTALLRGFASGYNAMTNVMVLHGDLAGGPYNPITPIEIGDSGLDYIALGHTHSFDGFHKEGKTVYAYSGCPEGRGFDETGEKGYIIGTVEKGGADLSFVPFPGRQFRIETVDITGKSSAMEAVSSITTSTPGRDVCRIVLKGEYDGSIDVNSLTDVLGDRFFYTEFRNETRPCRNIWSEEEDDTLKGLYIRNLRLRYEKADDEEKKRIYDALKFGIGALENREEWC